MRSTVIVLLLLITANVSAFALPTFAVKTVVIDAGHGGKDPGAIGLNKTQEKDVALAVALSLGKKINATYPDVKVLYTRSTDVFIPLVDRAGFANKNKADLFISIHCNSAPNRTVKGSSTYVLGLHKTEDNLDVAKRENAVIELEDNVDKNYEFNPNSPEGHIIMSMKQNAFLEQSIDVAARIESELTGRKETSGSRGVKQAGFFVLYKTSMPSLLAEIGFISNPTEEMYLASKEGQEEIADGLFNAFTGYKSHIEKTAKPQTSSKEPSVAQANTPPKQASSLEENEEKQPAKPAAPKPEPVKKDEPKPVNINPQANPTLTATKTEPVKKEEPKPATIKQAEPTKEEVKPEPIKETPKPEPVKPSPTSPAVKPDVVFKVQLLASSKALKWYPQLPQAFGKIDVETLPNGVNRFMTGDYASYEEAEKLLPKASHEGFPDAFIIAYKKGVRLDVAATRAYKK